MTTVTYRDGIMSADSRATHGDAGTTSAIKLFRKRVGRREHLIGIAGDLYAALIFVEWYGKGEAKRPEQFADLFDAGEDFGALIWDGRSLWECNRLCRLAPVEEPYFAIGSGAPYALAAMDCGKSAREAVRIACLSLGCVLNKLPLIDETVTNGKTKR